MCVGGGGVTSVVCVLLLHRYIRTKKDFEIKIYIFFLLLFI